MITTMAAYPAALQDLPPLGQTGLTDASMNDNNNNNNNKTPLTREGFDHTLAHSNINVYQLPCFLEKRR